MLMSSVVSVAKSGRNQPTKDQIVELHEDDCQKQDSLVRWKTEGGFTRVAVTVAPSVITLVHMYPHALARSSLALDCFHRQLLKMKE